MKTQAARELGQQLSRLIARRQLNKAYAPLSLLLTERTPFRLLDCIGAEIGMDSPESVNAFLDHIAAHKTMGGWVVIASALGQQLTPDLPGALRRARDYIIAADVWYATDILGERVPGSALVADFERAQTLLSPWREDDNRWIRRTVGVAAHFWAKRSLGAPDLLPKAGALLDLLEPMLEERETDAIKGVGWGLKTLGKYYPDLVSDWLTEQIFLQGRNPKALMLRKASTYLARKPPASELA